MSKYKEIQTQINRSEILKKTLTNLGLTFTEDEIGTIVLNDNTLKKVSGTYWWRPVQFVRNGDNFKLVVDDMDEKSSMINKIKQSYAIDALEDELRYAGWNIIELMKDNSGTVRMRVGK